MLSNKWTFSLTSLVVMLALAFVASSAMAGEFGITIGVADAVDVSYADGIQAVRAEKTINIKADKVVQIAAAVAVAGTDGSPTAQANARAATTIEALDFEVIAYNDFGGTVAAPALSDFVNAVTEPDGKNFTMTLAVADAAVTRVLILIPKHAVELADPRAELDDAGKRKADGKSAAASIEIHYVGAEPGLVMVIKIQWFILLFALVMCYFQSLLQPLMFSSHSVRILAKTVSKRITLMLQTQRLAILCC